MVEKYCDCRNLWPLKVIFRKLLSYKQSLRVVASICGDQTLAALTKMHLNLFSSFPVRELSSSWLCHGKQLAEFWVATWYRSGFLKRDQNHSPNSHQKIWRTNGLRTSALLGFISDIHRVRNNPENPVNVRKEPSNSPIHKLFIF